MRLDTATGELTDLGIDASMAVPLPTGHLLLGRDNERELVLQRFDLARGEGAACGRQDGGRQGELAGEGRVAGPQPHWIAASPSRKAA